MEVGRIEPASNQYKQTNQSPPFSNPSQQGNLTQDGDQQNNATPLTEKEVKQAVVGLNKMFDVNQTHLKFNYHEKMGEYYIQVIDDRRNEVIREIPSKKILDIVASFRDSIGILIDKKI